jgi:hypothetical protein
MSSNETQTGRVEFHWGYFQRKETSVGEVSIESLYLRKRPSLIAFYSEMVDKIVIPKNYQESN